MALGRNGVEAMRVMALVGSQVIELEIEREDGHFVITMDGESRTVDAHKLEGDFYSILMGHRSYEVSVARTKQGYLVRHGGHELPVVLADASRRGREAAFATDGPEEVVSQMPGRVVRILVEAGQTVEEGQGVVVVEAMKMENEIACSREGTVKEIRVEPGTTVEGGAVLMVIG